MQKTQKDVQETIIEKFNNGMSIAEIAKALLDDRIYRRWIKRNIGNEFDTRHFVEDLLCETAEA